MSTGELSTGMREICDDPLIIDQGEQVAQGSLNSIVAKLDLPDHFFIYTPASEQTSKFLEYWICFIDQRRLDNTFVQNR